MLPYLCKIFPQCGINKGSLFYSILEKDWLEISSPGLWVIAENVEEGVDTGFELPGSKNVREVGNIAFPPVEREDKLY